MQVIFKSQEGSVRHLQELSPVSVEKRYQAELVNMEKAASAGNIESYQLMVVSRIEGLTKMGSMKSSFAEAYKPVVKKIVDRTTVLYTILFSEVIVDLETMGFASYSRMLTAGGSHQTNGIIGASLSMEVLTELATGFELMVFKSRKEELSLYVDFIQELQKFITCSKRLGDVEI